MTTTPKSPARRPHDSEAVPTPAQVKASRAASALTQTQAAELIGATLRTWQCWEGGQRKMPPAKWELWKIKGLRTREST